MSIKLNTIYTEDCRETMRRMPDNFVNCVVTSPPYWGLRDYGHDQQIGLESTPDEYVAQMVDVFAEVYRVLRDDGTVWLNLGDSYTQQRGGRKYGSSDKKTGRGDSPNNGSVKPPEGMKEKNLVGIPWRVAFALQEFGWYLRQDIIEEVELYCPCGCGYVMEERIWRHSQDREIIWNKPNTIPESVKDRCTKAHEYIFLLSKSAKYYYDNEAISENSLRPNEKQTFGGEKARNSQINGGDPRNGHRSSKNSQWGNTIVVSEKKNRRSVWNVAVKPFSDAHFATFPIEIPSLCILAGCPENGIVYDPFFGSGTTGEAALKYNRKFIGSDVNPYYTIISNKRIAPHLQQHAMKLQSMGMK